MTKLTSNQVLIPINRNRSVVGTVRHGNWFSGMTFALPGSPERYEFLGVDSAGGLHTRRQDGVLRVFESSDEWGIPFPIPSDWPANNQPKG